MITREQLVEMFEAMERDAPWDTSGPLLWGYFFTDASEAKLRQVAPLLEAQGYRLVEIFPTEPDDGEAIEWWLHVEKAERHTADTLDARNQALYAFANEHRLGSYDGMDVGPIDAAH
ncbi:ribonuclease E inhibitor RraB [Lysobacter tyrosinilyticus]